MSALSIATNTSFFISVGDNFYSNSSSLTGNEDHSGVISIDDTNWKSKFKDIYTGPGMQKPIYAVLGNHDYGKYATGRHTSASAQIAYSKKKLDWRWNMPDHNFTLTKTIPGSKDTIQIVFIDTPRLQPQSAPGTGLDYGVPVTLQNSMKASHIAWITSTIKASTAKFLIVIGHYHSKLYIYIHI